MSLRAEPFCVEHLSKISFQPEQQEEQEAFRNGTADASQLEISVDAVTLRWGRTIVACFGFIPIWHGRCFLWGFVSRHIRPPQFLLMVRKVKGSIEELQTASIHEDRFRRIETTVKESFLNGHRLIKVLGFQSEGYLRGYGLMGEGHRMYSRYRK